MNQDETDVAITVSPSLDALLAAQRLDTSTTLVEYRSAGHCLLVGPEDTVLSVVPRLPDTGATLVSIDPARQRVDKQLLDNGMALFRVPALELGGHLGAFHARVPAEGERAALDLGVSVQREGACFDVVVDAGAQALIDVPVPPFGYLRVIPGSDFDAALAEIEAYTGTFEKPRYFRYDADRCAHARSSQVACTRCLDSCGTGAIAPDGEGIVVDPYRCQGCGSCAVTCPSGAIRYAYPPVSDAIARTRTVLGDTGARGLVLHTEALQSAIDTWLGQADGAAAAVRRGWLPVLVEEISAWGIDFWASMVAAGVARILLIHDDTLRTDDARLLDEQAALLHTILAGAGVTTPVVSRVAVADLDRQTRDEPPSGIAPGTAFSMHDDKRQTFRLAMGSVLASVDARGASASGEPRQSRVDLPVGSPFGRIAVDRSACTLCMACVSLCPGRALLDGQDKPALRLVEANCLQCGLCRDACPETAITLQPQYLYDDVEARRVVTLHEEEPFHCVVCHKPFATHRMIDTMLAKLGEHWMFSNPDALRRLKMCEDCRVRDIFEKDAAGIDVHRGGSD